MSFELNKWKGWCYAPAFFYALSSERLRYRFHTRNMPKTAATTIKPDKLPPIREAYHFQLWAVASAKALKAVMQMPTNMLKEISSDKNMPVQLA